MEDKIIELVVGKDEVTWQHMMMELVKAEGMDPWNVDISLLTQKYIKMLGKLKELDFRVSGKMVLAAALLLRWKTTKLVGEDMAELDRLMRPQEDVDEQGFYDDLESGQQSGAQLAPGEIPQLLPRTPQPRKRKVSIYDLMNALHKALEVRDRRVIRRTPVINLRMPERKIDITKLIGTMYDRIKAMFSPQGTLTFAQLAPSESRHEKILAFIPLLHLANHDERRIDLVQKEPFGEIEIILRMAGNSQPPAQQEAEAEKVQQ